MMTPKITDAFTTPELGKIAEIVISPVFQKLLAYYRLSRPAIVDLRTTTVDDVALAGAIAHGWEMGIDFWNQFASPPDQSNTAPEFQDMTSDLRP